MSGRLVGSIMAAIMTCQARRNSARLAAAPRPVLDQGVVMQQRRRADRLGR